jgi:hypothetical protein
MPLEVIKTAGEDACRAKIVNNLVGSEDTSDAIIIDCGHNNPQK